MPDAVWVGGFTRGNHCGTCGANVENGYITQHENFHKNYTFKRDGEMSNVKWCDYGYHAFKAGEQGAASFEAVENDENGAPIRTFMDACSEHNPLKPIR